MPIAITAIGPPEGLVDLMGLMLIDPGPSMVAEEPGCLFKAGSCLMSKPACGGKG